ncbi:MAG: chemotaxis protein CheA [Campylobacterales bacterium]
MDVNRLKEIFIEEASEIIEKLDIDIVNLEERSDDKDLMNELFRGVHTLKGSANSFGFTRLGKFVHAFEDVLDFYRNSESSPDSENIDTFLDAVDMIKSIFEIETGSEGDELPPDYDELIDKLRNMVDGVSSGNSETKAETPSEDLTSEFGNVELEESSDEEVFLKTLKDGERLFKVIVTADTDLYIRGQDHNIFIKNLASVGRVLESFWEYEDVPSFDEFDSEKNYLKKMTLYIATLNDIDDIKDVFEFIDEEEWSVSPVEPPKEKEATEEKPKENNIQKVQQEIEKESKPSPKQGETPKEQHHEEKRSFVKIDTKKLDELFDSVGELVIAQNSLSENDKVQLIEDEGVQKTIETLSKITRLVQNRVMSLRMVAIRDTFEKMKRVIRDSSRKVNKEVKLHISGEDTEIDKTMIDSLSDPLIHLLRNSVDHGIEPTKEEREQAGKETEGNIYLRAFHKGGSIVIEIEDDGRGINKEKVYNKALERGLISEHEELSDQQIYGLLMQAGFSTADQISDISGRGVGLDVVKTSIENLRGKVEVDSTPGKGTKFSIFLPLTLAIIDGMLVKSSDEIFIIPTLSIIESFRPTEDMIHKAEGKGEFVKLRDEILPIVRLNHTLELDDSNLNPWDATLVCAENEKGKFALQVDELVGRQQVVIKTLGKILAHLQEISGGAVMGNGDIALILNMEGIY